MAGLTPRALSDALLAASASRIRPLLSFDLPDCDDHCFVSRRRWFIVVINRVQLPAPKVVRPGTARFFPVSLGTNPPSCLMLYSKSA